MAAAEADLADAERRLYVAPDQLKAFLRRPNRVTCSTFGWPEARGGPYPDEWRDGDRFGSKVL